MFKKFFKRNDKHKGKVRVGWQKRMKKNSFISKVKNIRFHRSSKKLVQNVVIRPKKVSITERIVKSIIWVALRLAIRPKHWKDGRKNYQIIDRAYKRIMAPDFLFIPPAFAFYLVMAFMPITLLTLLIVSNIPQVFSFVEMTLNNFTGGNAKTFTSLLTNIRSAGAISTLVVMILFSLWIASGGFAKFVYTESYVYDHPRVGGYWMNKLRGMFIVTCLTIFVAIGITLLSLVPTIINHMGISYDSTVYTLLYYLIISIGAFIGIYFGTIALFTLSPRFKQTWRQVHPGALATTIPTAGFMVLFTLLTKIFFRYESYGVLGIFMTIAACMFQISYFIYVGIIVNVVFYKTHYGDRTIAKRTISKK
ncbi:YihY/virulence factor BrkB family protein [Mycoplasma marinum]|uniref:YihY/virulence factor BrkB family protein n=1 Tax=Mycoplasma marinum TaxID=1937190 RepID=A0A4R0XJY7_9MOLU|nr:YihY/virulence factor BrkB family protein [Mycoplasma marinum]TCG10764.1 hypothetical protein C4B24_03990 [Mycoplasma marinum]